MDHVALNIFVVIFVVIFWIGTCPKRRENIELDLNETYQEFIDQEFRVDEAYSHMTMARPSKVLSGWTYESKPKPLRSSRTAGEFRETEVRKANYIIIIQWSFIPLNLFCHLTIILLYFITINEIFFISRCLSITKLFFNF